MKPAVRVDDFHGAQMCNTSQSCLDLEHTCVRQGQRCSTVRDTDKTEKCACHEVFRLHLPSRARHPLVSVREVCEKNCECARILQSGDIGFTKSLQPSLFPPLVISPLSVLVFAPLRVLMFVLPPINFVTMMRKKRLREIRPPILTLRLQFC